MAIIATVDTRSDWLSQPFIMGVKHRTHRGLLALSLFLVGAIASGMTAYALASVDHVFADYGPESTRLISTFVPHGELLIVQFASVVPILFASGVVLMVACSESIYTRIMGWATIPILALVAVMTILPV